MKIKLPNSEDLELVYSFRSSVYFEQITGHNLDLAQLSQNDLITLFYSVFIASLQKAKRPIISMLDFLDIVDDNGGEKCVVDFSNWFVDIIKAQYEVLSAEVDDKKKKATSKKK